MAKDIQEGNGNASEHIKWLLQDYFKPLYVARRTNGLREGLELYINYMENEEGLQNFEFLIEEETATKKDYIDKLVLKIQQEVDKEEFEDMIANPEKYEKPIEYGVNYNEDILTELENWSWETPDMKPIVVLYEENIKEEFELLKHYQKDQEKIEHLKAHVLNRLAATIVDWCHIKFEKPRKNERSIQIYTSSRNEALVFSDETKINIWGSDGCRYYWTQPGDVLRPHHIDLSVKHGSGKLTMWRYITSEGSGYACQVYDGTMDSLVY
ncbi:hypothetical protein G6F18_013581 [Rhizopus arrhizus]|nr:hypothetical protein G6F19_013560 [Rhizopus arrhizus]KAG0810716.1 hypothetical protein G6F18_013581 [Rhizopus arrhizus]KAG1273637.1 hypothetical protein G6F66_013135 [Rhizopus arrhizus]